MDKMLLLVDDEEDIREVLCISLEGIGYTVHTAENGEEGLRAFKALRPPVVLTDIKMPGMDGIELLRRIKAEDPEVEVIMITGHGDMDLAVQSFKDEAVDFITKPIDIDALQVSLRRAYEKILIREKLQDYTHHLESLAYEKSKQLAAAREQIEERGLQTSPAAFSDRFSTAFDHLPCYVTVQGEDLAYTAVNSRFKADFGEPAARPCYRICRGRADICPECPVMETFDTGRSCQTEMEWLLPDRSRCNLLVMTSPIRDSRGRIQQVLSMSTDIRYVLDLQNHLTSLGLMVGSVSHGIKGMLTGLDGGVYLLDSGLAKENEHQIREGLDTVKQMVGRIRKMVLDILFYAKDRDLKLERIDGAGFAEDLASGILEKAKSGGIEFVLKTEEAGGDFEADTGFLRSALINILENALDACAEDHAKTSHRIDFIVESKGELIRFEIVDNGIGMDEATRRGIFDLFFSGKGEKGTGLGLFIARKIVEQHGGTISTESRPGQGTRMRVEMPRFGAGASSSES